MASPLAAISEPRRERILRLVWDAERSAGDIAAAMPEVTFSAVSQHLKVLHDAGAIRRRREGKRLYYQADQAALGPFAAALEAMWKSALNELKSLAEAEQAAVDGVRAGAAIARESLPNPSQAPSEESNG